MKFGCMFLILGVSLTILISSIAIGAKPKGPIWTDPAKAIRKTRILRSRANMPPRIQASRWQHSETGNFI